MSELIIRKLRDGRPLTLDERLWAADVLHHVQIARSLRADTPGLHRAFGEPDSSSYLAGLLDSVLDVMAGDAR